MIERRPRAPVLRSMARLAMALRASSCEGQRHVLHGEQALVLLDQRVLRLGEDLDQRFLVEVLERGDHRQTADEFGDKAELQQVLRLAFLEDLAGAAVFRSLDVGAEADRRASAAGRDDFFRGPRTRRRR